jgi:hypothetical protein
MQLASFEVKSAEKKQPVQDGSGEATSLGGLLSHKHARGFI